MSRLGSERVWRMALAGACAGLLTFIVLNPSSSRAERIEYAPSESISQAFVHAITLGILIGVSVGVSIILAEEIQTPKASRMARLLLMGVVFGAVCGLVGTCIAQSLYIFFEPTVYIGGLLFQVIRRTAAWAIMGVGAGICPGAVSRSFNRVKMGALGGLIGGGAGGLLFDIIGFILVSGSVSRFIGFIIMCAAIGAAVGLVEELSKQHWITMLSGTREGRSFILTKPESNIGKDELADIPLFGDQTVNKQHARISIKGDYAHIQSASGQAIILNSQPVADAALSDGDVITIGRHRLRFNAKNAGSAPQPAQVPNIISQTPQQASLGEPRLQIVSGPHAGELHTLSSSPITIGRDPGCNIPLVRDSMASRMHATVRWNGSVWLIEDNNSTNGLFVNQQRVTSHILMPGDTIIIGQSIFKAM